MSLWQRLFRRWRKRCRLQEIQLRIDHCRATIAEVEGALSPDELHPELAREFRKLEAVLAQIDPSQIDARAVEKIETATNRLLAEFRGLYLQGKLRDIHPGPLH